MVWTTASRKRGEIAKGLEMIEGSPIGGEGKDLGKSTPITREKRFRASDLQSKVCLFASTRQGFVLASTKQDVARRILIR